MPTALRVSEQNLGVPQEINSFVLTVGATANQNGTALYEAVCALFIAQALGYELSFLQQFIVILTATVAAIGAAGIPSAGLVTLAIVINAVGLPMDKAMPIIGMIYAVDRIIDMCRTMVNVEGDCVCCVIMEQMEEQDRQQATGANA